MECWTKTEEFDKFYKTVQAAHLTLLSTKYKNTDVEAIDKEITLKGGCVDTNKNISSTVDPTEGELASKREEDDYGQDTDFDPANGMSIFARCNQLATVYLIALYFYLYRNRIRS